MVYEEYDGDDYDRIYASRPPQSVRMISDSSTIASSVTGTTTIMSSVQHQIIQPPSPTPSPLPTLPPVHNNEGVLRFTEDFIDDYVLPLFPSLFDDEQTNTFDDEDTSFGQTNTILYECNNSDSETELDNISDWSSVITPNSSHTGEEEDENEDEDEDEDEDYDQGTAFEDRDNDNYKSPRGLLSLFDDEDTLTSYGQTNTILYDCSSTKQDTNTSKNSCDSETELDNISDWSSVRTASSANNGEEEDENEDDEEGTAFEDRDDDNYNSSRGLFIAVQMSQDGIEIHENNKCKSNEDKPRMKLGDDQENLDMNYTLEVTVQTSDSEDGIEIQQPSFNDDDDDDNEEDDEMNDNKNEEEKYEKEYCCDTNEKEDEERNYSTCTQNDAVLPFEVPDDELFIPVKDSKIDTVQTSGSKDGIEIQQPSFNDDDDDDNEEEDEMDDNKNEEEKDEKEYCCDINNEKEGEERNYSTFTQDDALLPFEVPDDELFIPVKDSKIDTKDIDKNRIHQKKEAMKKETGKKKPDPPSSIVNYQQRNTKNDPPASCDMNNTDPINVGSVLSSSATATLSTSTNQSFSPTTLNNEQNESSESVLTDEVTTMLTNNNNNDEEEQSSILTDELISLVNKNIHSNSKNNNIELVPTATIAVAVAAAANDCEREMKEERMDDNNTEDPPSPLWFEEDDTTTLFSEETTVVSAMTSPQDNDDDDDYHKYDDDDDDESSNLQLSVILNEIFPTDDAVPTTKDQGTEEPITNTEENSSNATTYVVHTDKDDCIPTGLLSSVKSDDDEPKKKKNDDTETIEVDLSVEKMISPSGDDDDTNNDDGDDAVDVALANETAKSRSATVDLVVENKKAVMNDDGNNVAVDVGADTEIPSHDVTVAIPPQSSLLQKEEAEDIQDVNQTFLSSCNTRNSNIHDATEAVYYNDDDDAMDAPSCDSTITTRATDRKANLTGTNRVIISVGMNESSDDTVKKPRFLKRIKKRLSKLSSKGGRRSSTNNNNKNNTSRRNGNKTAKACWYEHEDSVTGKHYYSHGKTTTWVRPEKELIVTW